MRMHSYGMKEIFANSSSERFTHFLILAYCVMILCWKSSQVLTNLWVDAERMMLNIESQNGLVMAEKVMIDLVGKGVAREMKRMRFLELHLSKRLKLVNISKKSV